MVCLSSKMIVASCLLLALATLVSSLSADVDDQLQASEDEGLSERRLWRGYGRYRRRYGGYYSPYDGYGYGFPFYDNEKISPSSVKENGAQIKKTQADGYSTDDVDKSQVVPVGLQLIKTDRGVVARKICLSWNKFQACNG